MHISIRSKDFRKVKEMTGFPLDLCDLPFRVHLKSWNVFATIPARSFTQSNPAFPSASPGTNVSRAFSPLSLVLIEAFSPPSLPGCRGAEGWVS